MTGVGVIPMIGTIWVHDVSVAGIGVAPAGSRLVCHSGAPAKSASNAYTLSFSVAAYTTLCVPAPGIVTFVT